MININDIVEIELQSHSNGRKIKGKGKVKEIRKEFGRHNYVIGEASMEDFSTSKVKKAK